MKTIERYVCEICKTEYKNKADAELCEGNHKIPKKIVGYHAISRNQNLKGTPTSIDVLMSDGSIFTYKR